MDATIKKGAWKETRGDFLRHLEGMHLGKRCLSDYTWMLNKLEKFMQGRNEKPLFIKRLIDCRELFFALLFFAPYPHDNTGRIPPRLLASL